MSLLSDHLFAHALSEGIPSRAIRIRGSSYVCPQPTWILTFGNELQDYFDLNHLKFRDGEFVCRDFAAIAALQAKLVWNRTRRTRGNDDRLALGYLGLADWDHEINFAFRRQPDQSLKLTFHEPQNRMREIQIPRAILGTCIEFELT